MTKRPSTSTKRDKLPPVVEVKPGVYWDATIGKFRKLRKEDMARAIEAIPPNTNLPVLNGILAVLMRIEKLLIKIEDHLNRPL